MKKTYISPEFLVVKLTCSSLIADSFKLNATGSTGEVLVKEDYSTNTVNDVNVWDEEW